MTRKLLTVFLSALVSVVAVLTLLASGTLTPLTAQESTSALQRIEERTAQLRELSPTGPINRSVLPRDQVRPFLERSVLEDNTAAEIEANRVRWEVLGYVPVGFDLVNVVLDVLGEQVLGFYDATDRTLYIVGDADATADPSPADIITLSHEITHALQDQHFELRALQEARRADNDQLLALQALIEGDATLLMSLYGQRYLTAAQLRAVVAGNGGGSNALRRAPRIVQRELEFPYSDGLTFLLEPFQQGGWAAINQIWRDPPSTTEQILHPKKYVAREGPVPVNTPSVGGILGPEWRSLETNTLGELDWLILFEQYTDPTTAERAATGWGGDRFELLLRDRDGAGLFVGQTAWDSDLDAREFFDAYQRAAATRHPGLRAELRTQPDGADQWFGREATWTHALHRSQAQVTLIIGPDQAAVGQALAALQP